MKNILSLVLTALAVLPAIFAADYPTPGATFAAKDYTSWKHIVAGNSRRGDVSVNFKAADGSDDYINMIRLDLVGSVYERGYAHGKLLAKEIVEFAGPALTKFYADEVLNIDLSGFPEPLQSVLRVLQLKGAAAAPELFKTAMAWVWQQEEQYFPSYFKDEISGMANGMCATLGDKCDVAQWTQELQTVNMLPELIRMACTAYGAWGKATPSGKGLIQLRALDFGSGPFVNYTVVAVHRGDPQNDNAFVTVSFPGFVGVITGVSEKGIGVSEKVWMTYDKRSLQPGSYNGEPDVFVLRDILQNARSKEEAEAYVKAVPRTWAIWIGIGDYASMKFDLVGYKQSEATVYNDVTAPTMTGQPYIDSIAYVDKHPQPSGEGPTGTLPTALQDFYGNITCENSKTIAMYHGTGDVHVATYDFESNLMYLAIGRINHDGQYHPEGSTEGDIWKANKRPYVKFNLLDLWAGL